MDRKILVLLGFVAAASAQRFGDRLSGTNLRNRLFTYSPFVPETTAPAPIEASDLNDEIYPTANPKDSLSQYFNSAYNPFDAFAAAFRRPSFFSESTLEPTESALPTFTPSFQSPETSTFSPESYSALSSSPASLLEPFQTFSPLSAATPLPLREILRPQYGRIPVERDDGPVEYNFRYQVDVPETGDFKTQNEARSNDVVQGSYSILQPDGKLRTVEYKADDASGFIAFVKYEDAGPSDALPVPATAYPLGRFKRS